MNIRTREVDLVMPIQSFLYFPLKILQNTEQIRCFKSYDPMENYAEGFGDTYEILHIAQILMAYMGKYSSVTLDMVKKKILYNDNPKFLVNAVTDYVEYRAKEVPFDMPTNKGFMRMIAKVFNKYSK